MTRSMREDARLLRPHLLRFLMVVLVAFLMAISDIGGMAFSAPGLRFFQSISYLNFFIITLGGISVFATAITEEKEENTLGLLKMADVSPVAILLGKGTTRVLSAVLVLSAQFPFTLLAITLGGVTMHQITAAYCTLLAYMLFVANLGLFCSVWRQRSSGAGWATSLALILFFFVPLLVGWSISSIIRDLGISPSSTLAVRIEHVIGWGRGLSAFLRIGEIMATGFTAPAVGFQVITNLIAAAALFVLSWCTFNYFNREERGVSPARMVLLKLRNPLLQFGAGRAWPAAFVWKDFHFLSGGFAWYLVKCVIYPVIILGVFFFILYTSPFFGWDEFGGTIMTVSLMLAILEISLIASRLFREELRWKTYSAIAMLPQPLPFVAYSKLVGCLLGLLPVLACFFVGFLFDPEGLFRVLGDIIDEPGVWYTFMQFFFGWHLVTFLSLHVKWGALPIGVVTCIVGNVMVITLVTTLFRGPEDGIFVLLTMFTMMLIAGLHAAIHWKLHVLAETA